MAGIDLTILGEPMGKGRPRMGKWGVHTPEKTINYETLIKECFMYDSERLFLEGQLSLAVTAFFMIPKSASKKKREKMLSGDIRPTKKPDIDNIIKIVGDALNGLAYHDDSAIVSVTAQKFYSETPRVEITIEEIN